jgi:hypothetical protein
LSADECNVNVSFKNLFLTHFRCYKERRKIKMSKNKTATLFALFLMFAMTFSLVALPAANAHTPAWKIPTYAYINVAPDPVGVGQAVNVGFWLNQPPPTASGPYGDRWTNMTVTVTHPDGSKENLGSFTSDDTGGTHTSYVPTDTGTYTFQMVFSGETLAGNNPSPGPTNAYIGDYFEPSTSNVVTLTVQQEPAVGVPTAPLPTNYWQNPINAMNVHNWYTIGGASLSLGGGAGRYNTSANYNPYTTAPTTAHILWTKPEAFGGVLGGDFGGTTTYGNYYSTAQYEKKYNPIIINGYLYFTEYPGSSTTPTANICVDLRTGKTVWIDNAANYGGGSPEQTALTASGIVTPLSFGQILDYVSPNQYGGLAYLWSTGTPDGINSRGTTYNMFDAETGTYILSIVNATRMTLMSDEGGNLIGYYVNSSTANAYNAPTLNRWNSTQCIVEGTNGAAAWSWRPTQNAQIDFSKGIMWSMPLAINYSGNALPSPLSIGAAGPITTGQDIGSGVVVLTTHAPTSALGFQTGWQVEAGYSAVTGEQLWIENRTYPAFSRVIGEGDGDGVYCEIAYATATIYGYDLNTGALLWHDALTGFNGAEPDAYDSIGGYMSTLANGTLYLAGFGGDIWSINVCTGDINWYTNTTELQGPAGTDSPYGVWPLWTFSMGGVAGGILFLEEGHEYSPPLFLGARQLAINCTTGELAWSIHAFDVNSMPVTAYGVMTIINAYDNQLYAYGKGPSTTTITASPKISVDGDSVLVEGTVTDISAGSQQEAVAANFPNGLPCVSDQSMSDWMEYVYMQQPKPTNATGVKVTVSVLDPNNNAYDVGTTTSNADGTFGLKFTPQVPGEYTIIATFAGSESYYSSYATTHISVSEAPAATAPPTPQPASLADIYFLPMSIAILIVVIVAAIAIVLMLRKR